jgi:PAS domain S-box-containing protein
MYLGTERRSVLTELVNLGQVAGHACNYPDENDGPGRQNDADPTSGAPELPSLRRADETRRVLLELQFKQVELERRNSALVLARDKVSAALEQYRACYDFAPVGYLTLGRDGVILAVNLPGAGLLGFSCSRLIGRHFGLLVAPEARPAFRALLARVFSRRVKESCEIALRRGGPRPSFIQIETIADASRKECHAVIIDISARRNSERVLAAQHLELAGYATKLEDANLELEAFNRTVAHELCTPLATINGFGEVLEAVNKSLLDERSLGFLQGIFDGTKRMKKLITSLLDFSRVARVSLQRESLQLSEMAQATVEELKLAQPDSRVHFLIPEGMTMNGDAGLCRIVLDNLIGNAWKHSHRGADTVIEVGMTELAGKAVCFVYDNGAGFAMAELGKLFTPFQRIPGGAAQGHGLGLATVKRIVKRHGGRVWAESSPGEGATFFFTLG